MRFLRSRREGATNPADTRTGIVIDHIDSYYGRHRALQDLSLAVPGGSTLAILGRNGAGKTTLLRSIINGFGVRVHGDVHIDGVRMGKLSTDQIVHRNGIAYVPDDRRIFPLTVLENLRVASLGSRDWETDAERVLGLFPFLKDHVDQVATTMSGGEQQALAIARAAMRTPRYLLLDEPGEGLAPIAVQRLVEGVRQLCDESNCTLIVVERNMEMIGTLCEQAIGVSAGRIIWSGAVTELAGDPALLERVLLPTSTGGDDRAGA